MITAEQAVLGCILFDNSVLKGIDLVAEDFTDINVPIFSAMLDMDSIDMLTLNDKTSNKYTMEILKLTEVFTAANLRHHVSIVKEASRRRKVFRVLSDISSGLNESDTDDVLPPAIKALQEIELKPPANFYSTKELTASVVNDMLSRELESRGTKTHIISLDNKLGCLRNGNLIVIGARPSMGKTALAVSIMLNMAVNGDPVIMFSLEMTKEELTERLLCQLSGVSMQDVNLKLDMDDNISRIMMVSQTLHDIPIYINDSGATDYKQIEKLTILAKEKLGIKCVFIDYLQLMSTTKGDNRTQQIGYITRNLKSLAKTLNIPIVLLSQLNRGLEQRNDRRPRLSDLRESGEIEQDADVIMFIYREGVYGIGENTEILIEKARNASIARVKVLFMKDCMKFVDLYED